MGDGGWEIGDVGLVCRGYKLFQMAMADVSVNANIHQVHDEQLIKGFYI